MPKYFCEYCGIYLTHSSPGGRNQHSRGRKHINNKIEYYSQILYEFQQNISNNLVKMTSRFINKPKSQLDNNQNETNSKINDDNNNKTEENIEIENLKEIPIKKTMIHIAGQMPLSVPLQYVPNIPINEKIMKAIPNKFLQPQFKKMTAQIQDDTSNREIVDINEGEDLEENKNNQTIGKNKDKVPSKNILENLKRMKYSYNDPNPDNNEHLLTDLLKNEEEDEKNKK